MPGIQGPIPTTTAPQTGSLGGGAAGPITLNQGAGTQGIGSGLPDGYGSLGGSSVSSGSSSGGNQQNLAGAGGLVPLQGTGVNPIYNQATQGVQGNKTAGFQYGMADAGQVDQSKIAGAVMPNMSVDKGENYQQRMEDAYYQEQQRTLDPQWQQRQADTETQLQNMGLTRGSEAWNREAQNLSLQRNDAYNQARRESILNSGTEAQRRQNMDIAAGNFGNQATQQNFQNEMASQTQQNAQQQQQHGQLLDRANLNNQGIAMQQGAAQGWKQIESQNQASQNALAGAMAQAGAQTSVGQMQLSLGQRQQEQAERAWVTDQGYRPYEFAAQQFQRYGGNPSSSFAPVSGAPNLDTATPTGEMYGSAATGLGRIPWGSYGGNATGLPPATGGTAP